MLDPSRTVWGTTGLCAAGFVARVYANAERVVATMLSVLKSICSSVDQIAFASDPKPFALTT